MEPNPITNIIQSSQLVQFSLVLYSQFGHLHAITNKKQASLAYFCHLLKKYTNDRMPTRLLAYIYTEKRRLSAKWLLEIFLAQWSLFKLSNSKKKETENNSDKFFTCYDDNFWTKDYRCAEDRSLEIDTDDDGTVVSVVDQAAQAVQRRNEDVSTLGVGVGIDDNRRCQNAEYFTQLKSKPI